MGEVLLNGRQPLDWELPAIEHGRQCDLDRDATVVAGLLPGDGPEPERVARPVTDIVWEFA